MYACMYNIQELMRILCYSCITSMSGILLLIYIWLGINNTSKVSQGNNHALKVSKGRHLHISTYVVPYFTG